MRRPCRRPAATALAALVVAGSLSACAEEPLPEPRPVEVDGPPPVAVESQVQAVRDAVLDVLEAGDGELDAEALKSRVAGPALELRTARYQVRAELPDQPAAPAHGGDLITAITPAAEGWPRFFVTVSQPAPDAVPQMHLMTQSGPREPYRLMAWVRLLPGITLPDAQSEEPPEALPPAEQSGLVASPAEVVQRYADVLTKGDASEHAAMFAEDAFRAQVLAEQQAEQEAVSEFFSHQVAHAPRPDQVWAVRTEDGGALVLAAMQSTRTLAVSEDGAKLPLPDDLAVLAGTDEAEEKASVVSLEMVAFAVPPEGDDGPVTVLGGERGTLSVTAS